MGIESLSSDVCSATLTPAFTEDNCSNGVLKVLRDARHFYRLKAYRTLSDGSIAEATVGDDSVYVYREITKQELVRCTNFVIADALYKAGIPYKTVNSSSSSFLCNRKLRHFYNVNKYSNCLQKCDILLKKSTRKE